jgi:glycosyltransferase involved in cell wall biosynthesis
VVAVSEATAQPLASLGYNQRRITIAYNGIDVLAVQQEAHRHAANARAVAGAAPHETVIAYAGRLDRHKGILDFIEAARRYCERRQDARFLLIGGPVGSANPDWTAIAAAIEDASAVRNRIVVTGFRHDVLALLDTCDVVTLPSHAEGFPRAVLEAMALGKPVVATSVGGIPEALVDGQHGLLVPPKDPAELARAWERLADDAALRGRLGEAGLERVRTRFTIDATTKAVVGMLESLFAN